MKYFFADSVDAVDPNYDFALDRVVRGRNRQYTDIYAHELLSYPPYDGILVSRSQIGGLRRQGRYSQSQRFRLIREGVREFLRYPNSNYLGDQYKYPIMGDCGSYSYIKMDTPPYGIGEVIDFYETCKFTYGVSPDHIILEKNDKWDDSRVRPNMVSARAEYTSSSAIEFYNECKKKHVSFLPIGVTQGWSIRSTVKYAKKLEEVGFRYIGIGGFANRPTEEIYNVIAEIRSVIQNSIQVHLFGFNRIDKINKFPGLGLSSFDSAAPMLKSFQDDKYNYFSANGRHYLAIRAPQLDQTEIKARIQSGDLHFEHAAGLEKSCIDALHAYGRHECDLSTTLGHLQNYERLISHRKSFLEKYEHTLGDRPWERCECNVCKSIGIDVLIYRGLNRNKRRGFHNLYVYYNKLKEVRDMTSISVPCIKFVQNPEKPIYSFVVNGKDIQKFAAISRIRRSDDNELVGYQRSEVLDHIIDIKTYLEKKESILPNSIVVAFNIKLSFVLNKGINEWCQVGTLEIPTGEGTKAGLVVDGQQRIAAIRNLTRAEYPVNIVGFESNNENEEREQFVLVNSTRPLPKSLLYELLPSINSAAPTRLIKRQKAYVILEKLNLSIKSPFYKRIKTLTSRHIESANIKDVSVLRMIENSRENGILNNYHKDKEKQFRILVNYWNAVRAIYYSAWELPPQQSRLTHGTGIISMGFLMDAISYKNSCENGILSEQLFYSELERVGRDLPWTSGIWHFGEEICLPWNEIQNTNRHIDIMTNYLLRRYKGRANEDVLRLVKPQGELKE